MRLCWRFSETYRSHPDTIDGTISILFPLARALFPTMHCRLRLAAPERVRDAIVHRADRLLVVARVCWVLGWINVGFGCWLLVSLLRRTG